MSGETFLCEVCGLLIDWDHRPPFIVWYEQMEFDRYGEKVYSSIHPSPHNHVPKLRKGEE